MYMREGFVRVVNRGYRSVEVQVDAIDDQGNSYGPAPLMIDDGLMGALGDGEGKWRLQITSEQYIEVMSLLESPAGHMTNVSAARGY